MALHLVPSVRPVLFGSMLLLMTAACQRTERSDVDDTTAAPQDTTSSQSAPAQAPPAYPGSMERERQEEERPERIEVTGRDDELHLDIDDELQPGGAMAGSAGSAGSGNSP